MQEIKMNGESLNIEQENIAKLKEIFPEVFNEDKIDFEKLQNVLGNYIDPDEEKYRFTWNGKMNALRLSQTPSTGTLRPCKEESRDWDTTQNLYIEGDNLEVLKLLQNSYLNKIKMIYIDPPYNTGNDFVYKDDFKDNITNYKKMTGQIDSEGNSTSTNKETDGRYHTNWLNMMYPRLRLARNLLTDNGVIFISIDNHEVTNLRKLCDEVFGEVNFVADFIVVRSEGGGLAKQAVIGHDYCLVYAKCINNFTPLGRPKDIRGKVVTIDNEDYWIETDWLRKEFGKYGTCPYEEIIKYLGEEKKKEIDEGLKDNRYTLIKKEDYHIVGRYRKVSEDSSKFYTILKHLNKNGINDLKEIKMNQYFDFPKPLSLCKELVLGATFFDKKETPIILDFFSGSATTAHAVMQLNMENMTNLKFIMVQFPELTYEGKKEKYIDSSRKEQERYIIDKETSYPLVAKDSEARKRGFYTISAIGKERIKKAGDKIKEEIEQENQQLKLGEEPKKLPDIGFKVFKLDSSNIRKWNPDTKDLERTLLNQVDNFVEGRKEEDALYEIILKNGLPLTVPVEELNVKGKKVYSIGMGAMIVCLDNNITLDIADEIAKISTEFEDKSMVTVVFKDNGFENDSVKTNIKETLRGYGIGKFVTV